MPELPEVENVRLSLKPALEGAVLERVEVRRPDLRFPFPERLSERLTGRTIVRLERRAKYLLMHLDDGFVLLVHLGMSGRFLIAPSTGRVKGSPRDVIGTFVYDTGHLPQHDHVVFHVRRGPRVIYNDPRRFGCMLLLAPEDVTRHALLKGLGVEPLGEDLDGAQLARMAEGRRVDLKAFLMDQRNIAGLGNIYVSEALFRAGLSPWRRASTLAGRSEKARLRREALCAAIRSVLTEAIAAGGSTLRDYHRADGTAGAFQDSHAVYDRAGASCLRPGCSGQVRSKVQSQRTTFYCPTCQR